MLRYFNEVYSDSTARDEVAETAGRGKQEGGPGESRGWEEVEWDLSKRDLDNIARAEAGAAALVDSVDLKVVDLPSSEHAVCSKWLKERKLSPDGFLQMAFQAAHHKMYGESAATYGAFVRCVGVRYLWSSPCASASCFLSHHTPGKR